MNPPGTLPARVFVCLLLMRLDRSAVVAAFTVAPQITGVYPGKLSLRISYAKEIFPAEN
jgi:hypothetical protein